MFEWHIKGKVKIEVMTNVRLVTGFAVVAANYAGAAMESNSDW